MRFLLTLLIICIPWSGFGQTTGFNKVDKAGAFGIRYFAIEPCGSGFLVAAYARDSTEPDKVGVKLIRYEMDGSISNSHHYTLHDSLLLYLDTKSLCKINNNRYALVANVQNNINGHRSWFAAIVDSNAQDVRNAHMPLPACQQNGFMYISDIQYDSTNHQLLAFGHAGCWSTAYWMLVKMDTNFQVHWAKLFGSPFYKNGSNGVIIEPDGYTMYGMAFNQAIPNSPALQFRSQIIKADTAGNELWSYLSPFGELYGAVQDLVKTPDNGYAFICAGDVINNLPVGHVVADWVGRGCLIKLDANRQKIWESNYPEHRSSFYGTGYAKKLLQFPDGSFLITGPWSDTVGNQYNRFSGVLKYDAAGNVVWYKQYKATDTLYWNKEGYSLNDAFIKSDGGFVFAGEFWNGDVDEVGDLGLYGWLVSTDSNACVTPDDIYCQNLNVRTPTTTTGKLMVYPNPAREQVQLQWQAERKGTATVSIYDLSGRLVLKQEATSHRGDNTTTITTRTLEPGHYILELRTIGGRAVEKLLIER